MYFKIALNNVKKSFKDYGIYFLTLTFAVCIFYAFNSIGNQHAMKDISASTASYIAIVKNAMSVVSVFVSVILGGLIIYANNFLIKRRKKELGIYMMLGMGKRKISQILVMETLLIGVISLIIGLGLGIILSQGLSVFTAKLFELSLSQYAFSLSIEAIIKTIIYFGVIFILVMVFNIFVINKYKLINLLTAGRKNEKIKIRNPLVSFIIFILGVLSLIAGYVIILKTGADFSSFSELGIPVAFGVIGTFLFFFGVAGFILYIVQKNKKTYLKGLNIFVTKQISSKMNTNFISMSIISLMLFITIVALSSGLGFKNVMENNLKNTTPFDSTIQLMSTGDNNITVEQALKEINVTIPEGYEVAKYNAYDSGISIAKLTGENKWKATADVISQSEYNQMMKLEGNPTVSLSGNEALITSDNSKLIDGLNSFIKSGKALNINGKDFTVANKEVLNRAYQTVGMPVNICTIVVPNNVVAGLKLDCSYLNLNYKNQLEAGNKFVNDLGLKYGPQVNNRKNDFILFTTTRTSVYAENKGMTTVILFITIYLGVIFLLTSAAVLALQQLSEASDSIDRYKSLRKIGVTNKMINKSVFIQTIIYFGAPLILAIIDSIIGLIFTNKFISMFGQSSILIPSIMTMALLIVIYIGYFIATYLSYRNIIKEK
ncbi:MAG: FtsX-like permease family protein [Sarcina sp.]